MLKADSFYKETILDKSEELSFLPSLKEEKNNAIIKDKSILLPDLSNLGFKGAKNKGGVYYISDIHLDHKIYKKFGANGNRKKVDKFLYQTAEKLLLDDDGNKIRYPIFGGTTIVILGDTSHSFEINKTFYTFLSQQLPYYRDIFVILGNHELWEFNSPEEAIGTYQSFFDSLPNIHLLHNALYISNPHLNSRDVLDELWQQRFRIVKDKTITARNKEKLLKENHRKSEELRRKYYGDSEEEQHKNRVKQAILTQDKLEKMTAKEIQEACFDSKTILFGTIGYAANNPSFNVDSGIYRNAITTKEQENKYSKEVDAIYKKLTEALSENYLIIASHMTLSDWSTMPYMQKWQYFSGHTHINRKTITDEMSEYADNQVGYYGKRIKFNAIAIDERFDYFAYYDDGIYHISESKYRMFYSGFSKPLSGIDRRGCENSDIIMLKKDGLYLFLIQKESTGQLFLLEGGKRRVLNGQNLDYYYDNMSKVNNVLAKAVEGIQQYLKQLSIFIKQIGGAGSIHGNIVDIDTFTHVMINLETGQLLPYFAFSVNDRYEFNDVPKLLESSRPDLYRRFLAMSEKMPILKKDALAKNTIIHSEDSSIYRSSNMMLKVQDMLDYNVIRFWNDELVETINNRVWSDNEIHRQINP